MFRGIAIFLALAGLICVLFPLASLFIPGGSMLSLDTRAYLGAGTAESVPSVSQVSCSAQEFGTSIRNGRLRLWDCQLMLHPASSVAPTTMPADPYEGMTSTQANGEFQRRLDALPILDVPVRFEPGYLERQIPFDRSGDLPTLRRMSEPGDPPSYGVIWGGRELVSRWLMWGCMALLMFVFRGTRGLASALVKFRLAWAHRCHQASQSTQRNAWRLAHFRVWSHRWLKREGATAVKKKALWSAAILVLSACASTSWPTDVDASAIADVPDHFVVIDADTANRSEPYGPNCRNPVADPRDGTRLTLVRSSGGLGDYSPPLPRYGLTSTQLLRIRCSDGRPVGAATGAP